MILNVIYFVNNKQLLYANKNVALNRCLVEVSEFLFRKPKPASLIEGVVCLPEGFSPERMSSG